MIRLFFSLLVLLNISWADFIQKVEVFESMERNLSIEEAKKKGVFKRTLLPIVRHEKSDYFIKVTLNPESFVENTYIIEFFNEFNVIEVENHLKKEVIFRHDVLEVQPHNVPKSFIFKIRNYEKYIYFDLNVFKKDDYIKQELRFSQLFGLAYGIIFTAFLYYLALYWFNRERTYIYYSLTQLSMLGILLSLSFMDKGKDDFVVDIVFFFFFVFSNLFTQYFLNTKKNAPFIHKILIGLLIIYSIDVLLKLLINYSFLEENIPMSFLLLTYLFAGIQTYKKRYKPALFYLIGWGIVIISFVHIEAQFYIFKAPVLIKPLYIIHLTTPIESLVLAFALSYKMKMLENERNEQRDFVVHQSKLASMGEMIANIAHQWRQPLTHLSYIMMNLKTAYAKDRLSTEYFEQKTNEANAQLEYMSHTIDDFRNFFKAHKKKEDFSVKKSIDEVFHLLEGNLKNNNIHMNILCEEEYMIHSIKGEFLQVMFNLINNAKQALLKNEIQNPTIDIHVVKQKNYIQIQVQDNALGIEASILNKVFEPYFTTKEQGLGLGLYMSKMIIEKNMEGKLSASNTKEGACFTIELKA